MGNIIFYCTRVAVLLVGVFSLSFFFFEKDQTLEGLLNTPKTYPLLIFVFILSYLLEKDQFLKVAEGRGSIFKMFGIFISYFVIGAIVFLLA